MPAGSPWLPPGFAGFPTLRAGQGLHRLGRRPYGPLVANPGAKVRFALTGTHAMFYAGATPSIAMWETLLRDVPGESRDVVIRPDELEGRYCVEIELTRDVAHLALAQAPMRALMPFEGAAWREVEALCKAPTYEDTHLAIRELEAELTAGGNLLPVLSWPSRQDGGGLAYLAYTPPMAEDCWRVVGTPIDLDTADGRALIHAELERCGMRWVPLATKATRKRSR
jgi:hypothetical protein